MKLKCTVPTEHQFVLNHFILQRNKRILALKSMPLRGKRLLYINSMSTSYLSAYLLVIVQIPGFRLNVDALMK